MKPGTVVFVAIVGICAIATYVHCLCGDEGDACGRSNDPYCCQGFYCIPPPRTCGGTCTIDSCSEPTGNNRGFGGKCQSTNQCQTPLVCKPPARTCGGVCAECQNTFTTMFSTYAI